MLIERHEIAKPWYKRHIVGRQSPSDWNTGEGRERLKRLLKRFKDSDDEREA